MHEIIRNGAAESCFASENDGSKHDCGCARADTEKSRIIAEKIAAVSYRTMRLLNSDSLNEFIDSTTTDDDPHHFEFIKINTNDLSEVDCISNSEDKANSVVNWKDEFGQQATKLHVLLSALDDLLKVLYAS